MCLDVLRAITRDGSTFEALREELNAAKGLDSRLDQFVELIVNMTPSNLDEWGGRTLAHAIALAVQGSLLVAHAPPEVAESFCATRLASPNWGRSFGTCGPISNSSAILERAAAT